MGLFDKFKEITRKVSEVESNIYHEKRDYLEIYERNIELEKEIAIAKIEMIEEYKECKERIAIIEEELKFLLIPKDPNDGKNIIVEIRGAVGGDEGNIFAGDLFRMYSRFAESHGYKIEINESNETENDPFGKNLHI